MFLTPASLPQPFAYIILLQTLQQKNASETSQLTTCITFSVNSTPSLFE
jgi:hypothetical protein